jgi:hypothetical protein
MKDICLWSHIALSRAMNTRMHSFLLPLITYGLPQHPDMPALPQTLNILPRLKLKQCFRKYGDMYSQLQILQDRVSTYSRSYLKKNKSRKWSLKWKTNKIKNALLTKVRKNRRIFMKLAEQVDGFILKCVPFIWSLYLEKCMKENG